MGYFGRTPDCRSCACNGFSNSCDVDTGICFNCTGKTTGSYCDNCEIGYYGDPLSGIYCKKCMCPGVDGIQHAEICKLNKDNDKVYY